MLPAFRLLAKMKGLRGTPLDLFGRTAERRMERALIKHCEQTIEQLLDTLTRDNIAEAAGIVALYLDIRGYGPVKEQAAEKTRGEIEVRLLELANYSQAAA